MATEKAPIVGSSASTSLPTLSVQDGTLPLTPGAQGMQTGTIDGHRQLQSPVSRSSSAGEDKMRECLMIRCFVLRGGPDLTVCDDDRLFGWSTLGEANR